MAKVIARFEDDFNPEDSGEASPFVMHWDLEGLRSSEVNLAMSKWLVAKKAEAEPSAGPFLEENGQLLVKLDDGTLAISSFNYFTRIKKEI